MNFTAQQVSDLLGGKIEGLPDVLVSQPAKIEEGKAGDICFLANPKYESYAYTTEASVLLVGNEFKATAPIKATLIRVENVYAAITTLLEHYANMQQASNGQQSEIDSQAAIHQSAQIGEACTIGAFAVVSKGVKIGKRCVIHPQVFIGEGVEIGDEVVLNAGVRIMHDCKLANRITIHANTVIGSDGFGFMPQADGTYRKVPQIGNVMIGNDVEIGANTVIDRATMGSTIIEDGVKLDNLIQIAHNVVIGANTVIAAQAGIAGSTKLGKGCMIGGQAGFVGHISVADGTKVQAQSGVAKSILNHNTAVYGSPALPYRDYLKSYAVFSHLAQLEKRVNELEK